MTKKIVAIWAQDENGLIGKGDRLPWSLPADLAHFKETTTGHTMVMGRVTFDGMGKRALPNRHSLVLTSDETYQVENDRVTVLHNVEAVLDWYQHQEGTLFVLGGGQIFTAFASYIEELIVTDIHGQFEGDVFFPKDFPMEQFCLINSKFRPKDEKNPYDFTIKTYERRDG
ncbi:dihydrofolate reductase [Streptococcus suis]|uniref:dihydrofolate reductase n=1 Tax=Streptococcus suis TaxID=1307 RepID=UPI00211BD087|nr:dihydrofolate reductase [Streptococcus suis]MCQ9225107.1 dihydrofolate reductase [Streptococcus suis]MCQ9227379.1 dihydrofolate reductase [Streptococcus suis]MCQ9241571.1 dihydrofolate reductase [Streptococcus suis]MCQ9273674.1 dihydrofolate reductase [Streptococcus suis]MDE7535735.1 dihydrofolate reductase [Streptococcus suis]